MSRRLLVLAALAAAAPLGAQNLSARVSSAPEGRVQFRFAARDGVCGNGRGSISIGGSTYFGEMTINGDGSARDACQPGPVHVVLDRAEGSVIAVETYVGGGATVSDRAGTDLGAVSARDASEYLLGLAARLDGRPGRDAILPAAVADSADPTTGLLVIARDRDRPRETRRTAMSWLARDAESPAAAKRAADALLAVARDGEDQAAVRQQALNTLARLPHGAGVPALVALAKPSGDDAWLSRESLDALARSGDPRARAHLRDLVSRADAPEPMLTTAVRGLARDYATTKDAALLRGAYPKLQGERARQQVLQSLAELGGSDNARWLLDVAQRTEERSQVRRYALQAAARAGVPMAELAKLWEKADAPLKEALLQQYGESGEKAALERLMEVAKSDDDRQMRRRAIQYLSRSDDPRAKALLVELAGVQR